MPDDLPALGQEDAAWDLPERYVSPIPAEAAEASADMRAVVSSREDAWDLTE
jgi:hypothetical protein